MTSLTTYQQQDIMPWDRTKIDLCKNTICKGSSDEEFQLFVHACQRTGLDPFMKQIHAVKRPERQKDGTYREVMSIQTGIDGFRLIADRTGKFAPGREPTYAYDKDGKLLSATAYVKKQTRDGTWHEVSATAFYAEYCQTTKEGKPTRFWANMPHGQLAKCAEALALRKAFPAELSGVYAKEEMEQADNIEIKSSAIKQETITKEQSSELYMILEECEPQYKERMHEHLKNSMNIESLDQVPLKLFEKIKAGAINNRDKCKAALHAKNDTQLQEAVNAI